MSWREYFGYSEGCLFLVFGKHGDEEFFISFVLFVVNFSFSYIIYVKLFSLANHNLLNCC